MKSLLPYAQLVRLPNAFTAMADIVLGFLTVLITAGLPFLPYLGPFFCLLIASTLLYWAGRPLPSGRIATGTAVWLGIGFFAGGVLFALLADLQADSLRFVSTSIAFCLVLAILLYDGAVKETWMGPFVMGGCRFLNILLGLSVAGDFPPGWGVLLAAVVGIYVAGVTLFARTEATTSSASDLTTAAAVIAASLLLALTVPALAQARASEVSTSMLFPYLLVGFGFYLGLAVVPAIRSPAPTRVQSAVKRALLGLVLLDALLASSLIGPLGLLLAILIVPGIYLGRWVYST